MFRAVVGNFVFFWTASIPLQPHIGHFHLYLQTHLPACRTLIKALEKCNQPGFNPQESVKVIGQSAFPSDSILGEKTHGPIYALWLLSSLPLLTSSLTPSKPHIFKSGMRRTDLSRRTQIISPYPQPASAGMRLAIGSQKIHLIPLSLERWKTQPPWLFVA